VPPLKIIFENNSFLISISHSVMEWWTIWCKLFMSFPIYIGLNNAYGHRNFWVPKWTMLPSGSSYGV
jgi:hypothetical protein